MLSRVMFPMLFSGLFVALAPGRAAADNDGIYTCSGDFAIGSSSISRLPNLARSDQSNCSRGYILQNRSPDGCSGGVAEDNRIRFRAACMEHDICYATLGKTRDECESDFDKNLTAICREENPLRISDCMVSAKSFTTGVLLGGQSSYDSGQKWAARNCSMDDAPKTVSACYAYSLNVDCAVDGIGNEGTTGRLTATFFDRDNKVLGVSRREDISTRRCDTRDLPFYEFTSAPVASIKLETDSGDAFMVDQVELLRDGAVEKTFGLDNDRGWCLSTDEADGQGGWRFAANGVCVPWHQWSYTKEALPNLPYDLALARLGATGAKTHRYAFDIDCDGTGLSNEGTGDTITAVMFDASGREIGRGSHSKDTNTLIGTCRDIEFEAITLGKATSYELRTDGTDAAFLDQIFVSEDGEQISVEGISNDRGWCLSRDADDGKKNWAAHTSSCRSAIPFDL